MTSVGHYCKAYKDAIPYGCSVLECDNAQAAARQTLKLGQHDFFKDVP